MKSNCSETRPRPGDPSELPSSPLPKSLLPRLFPRPARRSAPRRHRDGEEKLADLEERGERCREATEAATVRVSSEVELSQATVRQDGWRVRSAADGDGQGERREEATADLAASAAAARGRSASPLAATPTARPSMETAATCGGGRICNRVIGHQLLVVGHSDVARRHASACRHRPPHAALAVRHHASFD